MKHANMVVMIVLLAGCLMASPDVEERKALAVKGYLAALQSDNTGLKNDAMYQVARLRSEYLGMDLSMFAAILKKTARKDENAMIRLNAQLTLSYIEDGAMAVWVKTEKREAAEVFFNRLYKEMNTIFAANR